jgi:hypothetical protein
MTAIVLPDLNQKTIDDVRQRISALADIDLSKLELPQLHEVGKGADQAIDKLLGRSRAPIWPWIAAGIGLVALIGAIIAWFAFIRRPAWLGTTIETPDVSADDQISTAENEGMTPRPTSLRGLGAVEASMSATGYPIEEA